MKALHIVGWERYEHPDVRRYDSRMPWVKSPTDHTGLGFIELLTHESGESHFGVWNLVLQLAANGSPRGYLVTNSGKIMGAREVALKTHAQEAVVATAINRLLAVGWIERVRLPQASRPQAVRKPVARDQLVEKEKEKEKEKEGREPPPPVGYIKRNRNALRKLLRELGLASSETAMDEWRDLLQGPMANCVLVGDVLNGIEWLVMAARKQGTVKYSRDIPPALIEQWGRLLARERTETAEP